MIYGFNSTKSPKHTVKKILAAGNVNNKTNQSQLAIDSSLEYIKSRESA